MAIELRLGHGVVLPWAGRPLRFGMTLDEVGGVVTPYADLHDTFVCNTAWAKRLTCDDLTIVLFAGEDDALLGVTATRRRDRDTPHMPVGLDDIDLFGWPVDEVVDALRHAGRDVRTTDRSAGVDRDLQLEWQAPPRQRTGAPWAPPAPAPFLDSFCLYAPRRPAGAG